MQKVITPEPVSALTLLQHLYPGQVKLTTTQTAKACGKAAATVRSMRCRGTFPIQPTHDGKSYDIRDVAAWLDAQRAPKPRRGAPTKAERLARGGAK